VRHDLKNLYSTKNLDPNQLLTDLHGLFIVFTKRYSSILFCEGLQLCRLATLEALDTYNPSKKISVLNWIYVVIHHKLVTAIKYETNEQNLWERSHVRLDKVHRDSVNINRHSHKIADLIADTHAQMPYNNLMEAELITLISSIIDTYVKCTDRRKGFKDIKKRILTDYFVDQMPGPDMTKKHQYKTWDNTIQKFRTWVQDKCKKLLLKKHIVDRDDADRDIRYLVNKHRACRLSQITKKKMHKNKWKL